MTTKPLAVSTKVYLATVTAFALCMSILLLGGCRKDPQSIDHKATYGNLNVQIYCYKADLRLGEDDPMQVAERLDLYFFSSESEPAERKLVAHRHFGKADLATQAPLSMSLPVSSYYLVAVLNATKELQNMFEYGASWSKMFSPLHFTPVNKVDGKVTSVVWSNDQGPIEIPKSAFGKDATMVQIPLARVSARVRLFGTPTVSERMSIDLKNGGVFNIGSHSLDLYLMRQLAPLIGVSGNPLEEPGDGSAFSSRYAYSPGYLEIAASSESDYASLVERYRYVSKSRTVFNAESLKLIPPTLEACDLTQPAYYAYETTVDPDHETYSFLPSLLVGFKIYPAHLDALEGFSADEGWVSFDGQVYRGRDFVPYLKAILQRNQSQSSSKPTVTVPAGYPQAMQDVCEEYVKVHERDMQISSYPDEIYPIDFNGLRYYLRSYNYYYLPIRHTPDQEGYGHYGIVRNNDYRIEIQSISDYGSPLLTTLIDPSKEYISNQPINSIISLTPIVEHDDTADL